jgi:hypothetical protein
VYGNRRRVKAARSKRLQRLRSERVERSFAHVCETGGARRTWIRGLVEVSKRHLIQAAARNLGLLMRHLFGIGTARSLQGSSCLDHSLYSAIWRVVHCLSVLLKAVVDDDDDSSMALCTLALGRTAA